MLCSHLKRFKILNDESCEAVFHNMWLKLTIDRRIKVSLHLALFSANSRLLMSFNRILYLFICSQIMSSTHLWRQKTIKFAKHWGQSLRICPSDVLRCGLADVLDALQRIDGVWTAQDAGRKNDSQGVGWHTVGLLLQGDPGSAKSVLTLALWLWASFF